MKNIMNGFWLLVLLLTQLIIGKGVQHTDSQAAYAGDKGVIYEVQE